MNYIAHKKIIDDKDIYQDLYIHLRNVAEYAFQIGNKINLGHTSFLLGLCHDIGKYSKRFQNYIKEDTNELVNHSSAGGCYVIFNIIKQIQDKLIKNDIQKTYRIAEILSYIIFAHHGLFDLIDFNFEGKEIIGLERRMAQKPEDYNEIISIFEEEIEAVILEFGYKNIDELFNKAILEMLLLIDKILKLKNNEEEEHYYIHCVVRLLLSILKEADIYDSANAFLNQKMSKYDKDEVNSMFSNGLKNIEEKYKAFAKIKNNSEINLIRSRLSKEAKEKAKEIEKGLVMANIPTGSGKTLLTTRFALTNALSDYEKDRIFYITAFLSVLEQNAGEIKTFFDNKDLVLEHHSNVINDREEPQNDNEKEYILNEYLSQSWEAPVILTTMVQYANTQFKGRSANIRRFCKFINSVIIIDEIQSMPIKMTYIHTLMTNFITEIMGAVVVHATATQPNLDSLSLNYRANFYKQFQNLVHLTEDDLKLFKRTSSIYLKNEAHEDGIFNQDDLSNHIIKTLKSKNSILIILNTKKAVFNLYQSLKNVVSEKVKFIELTTNKTANHRLSDIRRIKNHLKAIEENKGYEKIVCISTALIEAGVDVDFEVVYRSMAPVPSLIQSMGRCNREGRMSKGDFYIFEYIDENVGYLPEILNGALKSKDILSKNIGKEVDIPSISDRYYDSLYKEFENELYFNTKVDGYSLFELLSFNKRRTEYNVGKPKNKKYKYYLAQNFKKASELFEFIEDKTTSVIVKYGESFKELNEEDYFTNNQLIEELKRAVENEDFKNIKNIMKRLQPFTLAVRNIDTISNCVSTIGDFYILNEVNYKKDVGLDNSELELLIF